MTRKRTVPAVSNETKAHHQRLQAAAEYYLTGSTEKAAKNMVDINASTIRRWRQSCPIFQNHLAELIEQNEEESRSKYRAIIQNGLDALHDRILHGNIKVEKVDIIEEDGKKKIVTADYRVPMTSGELSYSTGILIDKNRVSLGQPSRITKSADSKQDLEEAFKSVYNDFKKSAEDEGAKVVSVQQPESH